MSFDKPSVILDNGSYNTKAGFACDNHPVSIFRTVVGRPKYLQGSYGREFYEVFIGDDAIGNEELELFNPVVQGRIAHWDNMERVWHHIFYKELKVAPEERPVIMGCSTNTPIEEKIKCCEVFFETLNCPALCIQPQGVLAVYGSGLTTGLSVDLGYDTTNVNPVYEGGLITYAQTETKLPGKEMYNFIKQRLASRNAELGFYTHDVIEGIKQQMYVTKYTAITAQEYMRKYTLPSGEEIDISDEAFLAAELLFQPNLVADSETNYVPLPQAIDNSVNRCDPDLQTDILSAIIPWGGMAVIPGLNDRIALEVDELRKVPCNVIPSLEPYTISWLGGAVFASLPDARKSWVTRKQFEDHGAKIVRNRFM